MSLNILFMGTPKYAANYLAALIQGGYIPSAVITQPDRPTGRNKRVEPTPVKRIALENNIHAYQPEDIRDPQWTEAIRKLAPDVIVVVAFGQIIPKSILDVPLKGCINVHPSLLPKYRGAAPLQAALLNGDQETGVTIMQMDEKMDHGPIIAQEKIFLDDRETIDSLREKTTMVGVRLLLDVLEKIENGNVEPKVQDESQATYTKQFSSEDGKIDFEKESAVSLDRKIRALNPEPGVWTLLGGKRLKLLESHVVERPDSATQNARVYTDGHGVLLAHCSSGVIQLDKVQLEGKKPMSGSEFIHGNAKLLT